MEGQVKHKPFIRILVVILQLETATVGKTQFPPRVLPVQVEGGMHPHSVAVFANPLEFVIYPHNTQFPLTKIELMGLQTHRLFKAL